VRNSTGAANPRAQRLTEIAPVGIAQPDIDHHEVQLRMVMAQRRRRVGRHEAREALLAEPACQMACAPRGDVPPSPCGGMWRGAPPAP
jgi:hypothetical protein